MTRLRLAFKALLYATVTMMCIMAVNNLQLPKYFYNDTWPSSDTYEGFYSMDRDTVDVLFLGSSHAVSYFNPEEMYDQYGITSYNLGCEQQSMLQSYYWLKEALRYQTPKAVILDTYTLHPFDDTSPLNCSESTLRKSTDFMKWSAVKAEMVHDICTYDESQSELSYYLTNIRYHTRWYNLPENDYSYGMFNHQSLFGYTLLTGKAPNDGITHFKEGDSNEVTPMVPLMKEYLDKIVSICNGKGIKLILVGTPTTAQFIGKHNAVKQYADAAGIPFYDFSEENTANSIGYNMMVDAQDGGHGNITGAKKITDFLAELLINNYGIEPRESNQYAGAGSYIQSLLADNEFRECEDIYQYIGKLHENTGRYSIVIASSGNMMYAVTPKLQRALASLGIKTDFSTMTDYPHSYAAVITSEGCVEKKGTDKLNLNTSIRGGRTFVSIVEGNYNLHNVYGDSCTVVIGSSSYSAKVCGLNFYVYDNDLQKVVDAVGFNITQDPIDTVRE